MCSFTVQLLGSDCGDKPLGLDLASSFCPLSSGISGSHTHTHLPSRAEITERLLGQYPHRQVGNKSYLWLFRHGGVVNGTTFAKGNLVIHVKRFSEVIPHIGTYPQEARRTVIKQRNHGCHLLHWSSCVITKPSSEEMCRVNIC
jgi:hypothetical protein